MDRTQAIEVLNELLANGLETQSSLARKLGIHPSQVSKIAAGNFVRLDGHAFKVCKFAQSAVHNQNSPSSPPSEQAKRLQALLADLLVQRPEVAEGLELLMESLVTHRSRQ